MKQEIKGLQFIVGISGNPLFLASQAIIGGVDSIQFRHKGIFTDNEYELVCRLSSLCHYFKIPFIVNDRVDIALACSASGVHLGQSDIPISAVRQFTGMNFIIGATASSLQEAEIAENEGADYLGIGSVYESVSKSKQTPPIGLDVLKSINAKIKIPLLAIGGIQENNLEEVCKTGVKGIAVLSAISLAKCPRNQTIKLKQLMKLYGL